MWQKWKMWQKCGIKVKNVANALKMWQFGNPDSDSDSKNQKQLVTLGNHAKNNFF